MHSLSHYSGHHRCYPFTFPKHPKPLQQLQREMLLENARLYLKLKKNCGCCPSLADDQRDLTNWVGHVCTNWQFVEFSVVLAVM
ncbi:hypothetical protein AQUCO_09700008v1 [Aquilegia coerulea]|uniref:Uncharacterized protein n=1 Tax=Aquilegia coerulea TaxID=218851 RepID=A0A2G5C4C5_AQUCA|nr:hypothetical protein AQUCO_09700008v1 [Aquilegia coerulea]